MRTPDASVIVLAYGDEPLLQQCVDAVLASRSTDGAPLALEVLVVDNGSPAVSRLAEQPRVRVLAMGRNTGFAGGCNAGARAASDADHLVFLNSDALVEPEAVHHLLEALRRQGGGLACGSVRLLDQPETVNSVGNPVHYLGIAWAGGHGEPADRHTAPTGVASVTGAFFGLGRTDWEALGGFDETYFAYHEDVELSLRAHQRGLPVRYVPEAVALHDYVFSRNPDKYYLLERNRWLTVLTVYPTPLLRAALPALAGFELAVCLLALAQGWLRPKLRAYVWLLRHRAQISARRLTVQAASQLSPAQFADLLSARLTPAALGNVPGLGLLNALLSAYWRVARRLLAAREGRTAR